VILRYIVYSLLYSFLILGCADKDAFSKFHLQEDEALAVDNLKTFFLRDHAKHKDGVVSCLYLNEIYPDKFTENENFYIAYYGLSKPLSFQLNNISAQTIQKLPPKNEYTHLVDINASWVKQYYVVFPKQNEKKLHLKIQTPQKAMGVVVFQKNQ